METWRGQRLWPCAHLGRAACLEEGLCTWLLFFPLLSGFSPFYGPLYSQPWDCSQGLTDGRVDGLWQNQSVGRSGLREMQN